MISLIFECRCLHVYSSLTVSPNMLSQMKESIMNQEKLAKLQAQVRIGGKVSWEYMFCQWLLYLKYKHGPLVFHSHTMTHCGTLQGSARRKKKVVHRTATADDKKLQFSLKKLGVNNISGIEEVAQTLSEMHRNKWDWCYIIHVTCSTPWNDIIIIIILQYITVYNSNTNIWLS